MRKYSVDGTIFDARSYGEFMLNKQYTESSGATLNPAQLSEKDIERIGLSILEERMMESEDVFEITDKYK